MGLFLGPKLPQQDQQFNDNLFLVGKGTTTIGFFWIKYFLKNS